MANNYLIVGAQGQGKSHFVKEFIRNKNAFVFDVNAEYDFPVDLSEPQCRHVEGDFKLFATQSALRKNTNIVMEEATGFVRGNISAQVIKLLVNRRHSGNNYLLLFHSIDAIPKQVLPLMNFLVLHKTLDAIETVKRKYPLFLPAYIDLKKNPTKRRVIQKLI